ncbi:MAG: hypothetical protein RL375_2395 [Pseudomonadota bacterium]|jgi:hypothetical protein
MTPKLSRLLCLVLALLLAPLMSGCMETFKGAFTNRVACTVAMDECLSASRWGPIAITGDVDARDTAVLIEALRIRIAMEALRAAAAQGK